MKLLPMQRTIIWAFKSSRCWLAHFVGVLPNRLVRLVNGKMLAQEIRGNDSPQNKAKRDALAEWVSAINASGGFGTWAWDVAFEAAQVHDIISRHSSAGSGGQSRGNGAVQNEPDSQLMVRTKM
jgi:hypothetical protein